MALYTPPVTTENPLSRKPFFREVLIFAAFLALTVLNTWPWATMIRDGVPDPGDPYLNAWIIWQAFHGFFSNPFTMFHGNIFYPYQYSLAFSEHNFGLALPFFPLLAIGVRPLTVHGLTVFYGFALSGYGAFRLTRTLSGSTAAAWIAGIGFAFVPYRYQHLSHSNYISAGWIALVLEALILFSRERTNKRALWLGAAFLMNGLSCIHWFVLSALPLGVTGLWLAVRNSLWKCRDFWRKGAIALGVASLLLLPFFIPYKKVRDLYGLQRSPEEAAHFSAKPINWMTAHPGHHVWEGLGLQPPPGELSLFPGLLLPLLALAAILLMPPARRPDPDFAPSPPPGRWIHILDVLIIAAGVVALFAAFPPHIVLKLGGKTVFSAQEPTRAFAAFAVLLLVRCLFAYPKALAFFRESSLYDSVRAGGRPESLSIALLWGLIGFAGSFGMNFFLHRTLFEFISLYRSIRAPVRWTMIAMLGLSILAGLGAVALTRAAGARWERLRRLTPALIGFLAVLLLWENRVAPLTVFRGRPDPDPVSLYLKGIDMKGGLAVFPVQPVDMESPYLSVLRAADHGKPLITGVSGFGLPIPMKIEELANQRPIPVDALMDHLESIPASYLIVREWRLGEVEGRIYHRFLAGAARAGRLRFIKRFGSSEAEDLWAVVKIEPAAKQQQEIPWISEGLLLSDGREARLDTSLPGSVDGPSEGAKVTDRVKVRGWARAHQENLEVFILVNGARREPLSLTRGPRPDVCAAIPSMGDCSAAGWETEIELHSEDVGTVKIEAVFLSRDGRYRIYPAVFVTRE